MTGPTKSATPPYYTMFFDQSAHLDWDWIRTFAQNFWYYDTGLGVNDIIAKGIENAQKGGGAGGSYYYTVCEMGFFRRFIEVNPGQIAAIKKLGDNFQVISGGVTSPDNLVCSAEGFIRNYLVGQTWLWKTLEMEPKPQCWLPDDFGQGPELPALLAALGFVGMAFSRLPGMQNYPNTTLQDQLVANGLDFIWQASDGSSVIAHWLIGGYNFGNQIQTKPKAINDFISAYYSSPASLPPPPPPAPSYTGAATPFMYIPIDDDFSMPIDGLKDAIDGWNNNNSKYGVGVTASNVTVVQGTFDHFIAAVKPKPGLKNFAYNGTPYWTGYYASRPELKTLHYATVRALTAAEVIGLLTQPGNGSLNSMLPTGFWQRIDQAWDDFAPSTHHDYVCGTAPDPVYANDQLPLLRGVAATAESLRGIALDALAGMACGQDPKNGVIVANPLGFKRSGVAAIEAIAPFPHENDVVTWADGSSTPAQTSAEGGMLVYASVPSFGYITGKADGGSAPPPDTASLTPSASGAASYTIGNEYLSAIISATAGWGIENLLDVKNGNAPVLSGTGNSLVFYSDGGDIYQFGNERQFYDMPVIGGVNVTTDGAWLGAMVMETGPLRSWLRTAVLADVNGTQVRFTRDYMLCAGEPFLRMTTTGAAPASTSVMAAFPLASSVTAITHGTGYHWTEVQPLGGLWSAPVFRPTQDFVLPQNGNTTLAAVYHGGMPAWAIDADGTLIGCLLRNTPGDYWHGASGSDPAPHTQHYALRVPTGLGPPATGQPLQEALGFHTPLLAARMPDGDQYGGMLTAGEASLAALPAGSPAVLTVAKPGSYVPTSLVLRLYQPTNTAQTLAVTLPATPSAAELVTATENTWSGGGSAAPASSGITVTMAGALATVSIAGMGLGP